MQLLIMPAISCVMLLACFHVVDCCSEVCCATPHSESVPFKQTIGGLYPGKMIFINGIMNSVFERTFVNFKCGEDVALHFDIRADWYDNKEVIVRNALINDVWGSEERELTGPFPFKADKFFEIIVLVEPSCYKVAVDDQHLLEFNHRITPLEKIDTLEIHGDVRLSTVRIQG